MVLCLGPLLGHSFECFATLSSGIVPRGCTAGPDPALGVHCGHSQVFRSLREADSQDGRTEAAVLPGQNVVLPGAGTSSLQARTSVPSCWLSTSLCTVFPWDYVAKGQGSKAPRASLRQHQAVELAVPSGAAHLCRVARARGHFFRAPGT